MRAEELALLTGMSLRTARRWKATGRMPASFALGLALLRDGDLGVLDPEWRGWRLIKGQLYTPDNWGFRPGELVAVPILYQLRDELQRKLKQPQQYDLLPPQSLHDQAHDHARYYEQYCEPERFQRRRLAELRDNRAAAVTHDHAATNAQLREDVRASAA